MLLPRELPMHRRECLVGHLERHAARDYPLRALEELLGSAKAAVSV